MARYAIRQCMVSKLDPAEVFSQQFHLSKNPALPIEGFAQIQLDDWVLSFGSDLCVVAATLGPQHFAFIGVGVDRDGDYVTKEVLTNKLSACPTLQDRLGYLAGCAGRYAYVVVSPEKSGLYLDPVGTLGVVFNPETQVAASTVNLALDRRIVKNDAYPMTRSAGLNRGGRFAFGHTQDVSVKRLLANHALDLESFAPQRHWDYGDDPFACDNSIQAFEQQVDLIIARHKSVINALARHHERAILPLSGGADSRILLACAKDVLDEVELVSHAENWRSQQDIVVARKLADAMGRDLRVVDAKDDPAFQISDPDLLRSEQDKYRVATGLFPKATPVRRRLIEVNQGYPAGGVLMRGHVTDILKAVLWRNIGIANHRPGHPPDVGVALRLMMLGAPETEDDPELQAQYRHWFDTLPEIAQSRPHDFMGIEQFRTHGMGVEFYAFTRNFFVCPGNDRAIIRAACSLPPELRVDFHFNDMLLQRVAPELADFEYNRPADNKTRQMRKPLTESVGP